MNYQIFQSPAFVRDLVKNFFVIESLPGESIPTEYQSMADGCPEIIIQFNGGFQDYGNMQSYLRPQHSSHQCLKLSKMMGLFGIRLYPHAIQEIFSIPSDEVVNKVFDLNEIVKQDFVTQVIDETNVSVRIEIASAFLHKQRTSRSLDPINKIVHHVMQSEGDINIPAMLDFTGLSERQFERRFKAVAGFTPKHYARIMRFLNTKRRYASQDFKGFAELAEACKYCDQSHFNREFKEFSGMIPSKFFKLLDQPEKDECQILKGLVIAKDMPT